MRHRPREATGRRLRIGGFESINAFGVGFPLKSKATPYQNLLRANSTTPARGIPNHNSFVGQPCFIGRKFLYRLDEILPPFFFPVIWLVSFFLLRNFVRRS